MYSEKHKICMTISQGRKKNIFTKRQKKWEDAQDIYTLVLIWAFRKCHIKIKQNVLVFNVKHLAHVCDAVLHMTNNFFCFLF